MLTVEDTLLDDVKVVTTRRFADDRGFFTESYNRDRFREAGITAEFIQDNHSRSELTGTVRGLHYQSPPFAQAKLVRVVAGAIYDVAVDVRKSSPDFGKWVGVELSAENGKQLFVPEGFLHGFMTLTPDTHVVYKVNAYYSQDCDGAVRFDDADLGIEWPLDKSQAVLSDKDAAAPSFREFNSPF